MIEKKNTEQDTMLLTQHIFNSKKKEMSFMKHFRYKYPSNQPQHLQQDGENIYDDKVVKKSDQTLFDKVKLEKTQSNAQFLRVDNKASIVNGKLVYIDTQEDSIAKNRHQLMRLLKQNGISYKQYLLGDKEKIQKQIVEHNKQKQAKILQDYVQKHIKIVDLAQNEEKNSLILQYGLIIWRQFYLSLLKYMLQQETNYFKDILNLLKEIAFHQIYMESARKQLCQDQNYDPHTAFKSMDHFKHNRVIAYELYSFFQLNRIETTTQQCENIIKCLDKSLTFMDYESFEEMTLPNDLKLKNLSKNRYNNVKIEVGSYSKLTFVKYHSAQTISLFLQKQLNFYRNLLSLKQQFCRKWGGDVYTLLQKLFKNHNSKTKQSISFSQFYQFSRLYGLIFNFDEFRAFWRRSKSHRESLNQIAGEIFVSHQQLSQILLVSNFNTKEKYGLERNIPITKALEKPVPSYKTSHWRQHEQWQRQQKNKQLKQVQDLKQMKKYNMKYKFSGYLSTYNSYGVYSQLRNKNSQLRDKVQNMDDRQLSQAYQRVTSKLSYYRPL